ncbi:MAG: hypothetical protein HFJ01_15880 [Lachnospiraceae bacterium]|jgi:competence protein ComEA|nr:hypothetical protein [Lachnospiraceae bacterium]
MKEKIKIIAAAGILALSSGIFSGCGDLLGKGQEELLLTSEPANTEGLAFPSPLSEGAEGETVQADASAIDKTGKDDGQETKECVVHICGAVVHPGVYTLEEKSRVYQAIDRAGGFLEDADADFLNQADFLSDGMKLYVPTKEEVKAAGELPKWQDVGKNTGSAVEADREKEDSLVNINTAGEELLCTLPGIGSSKAMGIISYREKNGSFRRIEDIMNVEGIKEGLFQKIRDKITV